jgi:hypothetical protein
MRHSAGSESALPNCSRTPTLGSTKRGVAIFVGLLLCGGNLWPQQCPTDPQPSLSTTAPCSFSIDPTSATLPPDGAVRSVRISASAPTCEWVAKADANWIVLPRNEGMQTSGVGDGVISYSVPPNSTGSPRASGIVIAGKELQVQQSAATGIVISGQVRKAGAALSGVAVTLSGASRITQITNASGSYSFTNVPAGSSYTVTPSLSGHQFAPAVATLSNLQSNQTTVSFTAAVVNGSGFPDRARTLMLQNIATRQTVLWYMGGEHGNEMQRWEWITSDTIPGWSIVARADLDGDGVRDLIWQNDTTRQVSVWYLGGALGNTLRNSDWISSTPVPGWHVIAAADLNSDGKPDLVWQNELTGQVSAWYMKGDGGNTFQSSGLLSSMELRDWRVVAVADLDGNGKPDLIWQHNTTRQVSYWLMSGALGNIVSSTGWISSTASIPGWRVVGATDVDGDGKIDLLWQNDATQQASVWFLGGIQGTAFLHSSWIAETGVNGWRVLAP